MKTKHLFLGIIIMVLCIGKISSQIILSAQRTTLSDREEITLDKHLSQYTVFSINKKELIDSLYTNGLCQFQININEQFNWTFDLQFNDMRSPDYKQTYTSDKGIFEDTTFVLNTFKGTTSDNKIARFTIDENNFFGVIFDSTNHYIIRPATDYAQNLAKENLIVYKSSDIIPNHDKFDYVNDALEVPIDSIKQDIILRNGPSNPCTYYLAIATDADYNYYQAKGNNLANTYSDIFSVLNIIEGVYESTFNMKLIVVYQNVWTTTSGSYPYTSTDASTLLRQFQTEWKNNRTSISRNIAHLFTGKGLDGGVYGMAWRPGLGTDYSYSLSMNRAEMYQTTAHEIGHNLNAIDNPTNCFCGTANASVMCQGIKSSNLWFCQQSINEITPYLSNNYTLVVGIPFNMTLSGSSSGFKSYKAVETITSTQVINSGFTSYESGIGITLKPGFHAKAGSHFIARTEEYCGWYGSSQNYSMLSNADEIDEIKNNSNDSLRKMIFQTSLQEEIKEKEVHLFPNPNTGFLHYPNQQFR